MSSRILTFILLLPLFAGCLAGPAADDDDTRAPDNQAPPDEATDLHLEEHSNFTMVVPFRSETPFTISNGNVTLHGPRWKGFFFLRMTPDPRTDFYFLGHFQLQQESASHYTENAMTGERTVECLNAGASPPCPLSSAWDGNITDQDAYVYTGSEIPAGPGYFLVHARFAETFRLNLTFDRPIRIGTPVLQSDPGRVVTWDKFTSKYADVSRCGETYACGTMIDGQHPMDALGHDWLFSEMSAFVGPGGFLNVCHVSQDAAPDCIEEINPCGTRQCVFKYEMHPGTDVESWQINAVGARPTTGAPTTASLFMFTGTLLAFDLPDKHPFT